MRRRLAIGVLATFFTSTTHAQPLERGALKLEWTAPGGCPNGVEVLERIETLLGARVAELRPEPLVARGRVTAVEALRFELELETEQAGQRFTRSMQAPSCAELGDAGALVLALAIDPERVERQARAAEQSPPETSSLPVEPPPGPAAGSAPPAPPPEPPQRPPPPRTDSSSRERVENGAAPDWFARIGLLADLGTVSGASFGPRAAVAARWRSFRAELGFVWLPPARSITARNPDRGGDIDLVAVDIAGCFLPIESDVELAACAGIEAGKLHGAGFGTVVESEGSAFWFGAGATGLGRLRATDSLGVVASAGLLFIPQDTEFTLENVGVVRRIPDVVGRLGLGVEAEFP